MPIVTDAADTHKSLNTNTPLQDIEVEEETGMIRSHSISS
jgi:hypothetical protein